MCKVAKDVFFRSAYRNNENEREHWQREVLVDFLDIASKQGATVAGNLTGKDMEDLKALAKKLENHTLDTGNDLVCDWIIERFLEIEDNKDIKNLVSNIWVGLWDSSDTINAGITNNPYYDESYLIRFTSEFQILIRKIAELFSTVVFLLDIPENDKIVCEVLMYLLSIELHDICCEDTEIGVKNYIDMFPESMHFCYEHIFRYSFLAGCAFVIFHEIGHRIEDDENLARYYKITPSSHIADINERKIKGEYNADLISMKIIQKIFGQDEETCWLGYAGILICFLSLSIRQKDPTVTTDHPSIKNRYLCAKEFISDQYGATAQHEIIRRVDAVAYLLAGIADWSCDDWWRTN
ncbi:MAG: hypothetical protein IJX04_09475 [Oscillospiraceae bacterium]|nr:hypothetical protein [Oscillospiraceae bacterium]